MILGRFGEIGELYFDIDVIATNKVILDGQEYIIPVIATIGLAENLLGLQQLKTQRIVVNLFFNMLTLANNRSLER
ncbi:hypothetical protein HC931_03015 [Candidatus Gracilibacteria bacterium]|jgi:predicted aspartyl protease|nr:hypothetical protein [Candidatus Gracilibacteria bacterium]NJM86550.1 hypothetical protein [Hydrococcus sp. RU_2_2]NJP18908.1 hypothetical protein [Hydrococcus sp. CRU_1_1]NJQ97829.1 hypothetical protein [Hydrococcus sp. CSU_1_8]